MHGPLINLEERPGLDKKRHLKNFNERHSKLNSIKENKNVHLYYYIKKNLGNFKR